jgi:hypothetical protein
MRNWVSRPILGLIGILEIREGLKVKALVWRTTNHAANRQAQQYIYMQDSRTTSLELRSVVNVNKLYRRYLKSRLRCRGPWPHRSRSSFLRHYREGLMESITETMLCSLLAHNKRSVTVSYRFKTTIGYVTWARVYKLKAEDSCSRLFCRLFFYSISTGNGPSGSDTSGHLFFHHLYLIESSLLLSTVSKL